MHLNKRITWTIISCALLVIGCKGQTHSALSDRPLIQNAARSEPTSGSSPEELMQQLVEEPDFGLTYIDDGAGDGTVVRETPQPVVRKIIDLGPSAIPILIEHLDDRRLTSALYKGGHHWKDPIRVPLGFVSLDLLIEITRDTKLLFINGQKHCEFDGMGACVKPGYYAKPGVFLGSDVASKNRIKRLKQNWQKTYRNGAVRFERPEF